MARQRKTTVTSKKTTASKPVIKKEVKEGKVQVEVLKGYGDKFGTDNIKDGSVLTLPRRTASELVQKGFVKLI